MQSGSRRNKAMAAQLYFPIMLEVLPAYPASKYI